MPGGSLHDDSAPDDDRLEYLAIAQHKLRTPMAVLAGWTATLDMWDRLPPDDRAEGLAAIGRATAELRHQIEDLFLEARADLRCRSLASAPVDLAGHLRARFAEEVPSPHPVQVTGDTTAMAWVDLEAFDLALERVLDNAVTYSPGGGPIDVHVEAGSPVAVEVRDQGIGLDVDVDVDLFAPFQRGLTAPEIARGTGLGLHVAATLIRAMDGEITIGPAEDGTVVRMELPSPS